MSRVYRSEFDESLNEFVDRYGLKHAAHMLKVFVANTEMDLRDFERQKLIIEYLVLEAIKIFDVRQEDFFYSTAPMVKETRWATLHLLKAYTRYTNARIGRHFGVTERSVKHSRKCCKQLLESRHFHQKTVPKHVVDFVRKYEVLERKLIAFIPKVE